MTQKVLLSFLFLTGIFLLFPLFSFAHEETSATVVHMHRSGYTPQHITIAAGEKIIFENTDTVGLWPASNIHPTHEIYSAFDPQKEVAQGQSWEFVFTEPGIWQYHDHVFPAVSGTITVNGTTTPTKLGIVARFRQFFANYFSTLPFFKPKPTPRPYNADIDKNAPDIFSSDEALYSYLKKFGPKQTVEQLHALSSQFGDCHQRAHEAGHLAYEVFANQAFQTCSAECHSGCYHGATEAYFKEHGTNNLGENLKTICSSELNSFFSHQCIHGIGHGLMAWSNYEIHSALEKCDLLPEQQASCYSGVFMENIVGGLSQAEGHKTNYLSDDPQFPCTVVAEKYKPACYFYQTSRMTQLFNADFARVSQACLAAPNEFHLACFESMGRDIDGMSRTDPEKTIAECGYAPHGELRSACLSGAVQDTFWDSSGQDLAVKFCQLLTDTDEKNSCYQTIFYRAQQVLPTTQEQKSFCEKVEPGWGAQCEAILTL